MTPYAGESDWVFASFKLRGKQPREGNMIGADCASLTSHPALKD
jgi:hypothetical protein